MSKEKLIWRDRSGQAYYFDYKVDVDGGVEKSVRHARIVERLKTRLLQAISFTQERLNGNHKWEEDLVGAPGLEPGTSRSQSAHSTN